MAMLCEISEFGFFMVQCTLPTKVYNSVAHTYFSLVCCENTACLSPMFCWWNTEVVCVSWA